MKKTIVLLLTVFLTISAAFGQGVKLSTFQKAVVVYGNEKFIITVDSNGVTTDKQLPVGLFVTYLANTLGPTINFTSVLRGGNVTDLQAFWSDGTNLSLVEPGHMRVYTTYNQCDIYPQYFKATRLGTGGYAFMDVTDSPKVGISDFYGSHKAYFVAPFLSADRSLIVRDRGGVVAFLDEVAAAADTPSLQQVATKGNSTTKTIKVGSHADSVVIYPDHIDVIDSAGNIRARIGISPTGPVMAVGAYNNSGLANVKYINTTLQSDFWLRRTDPSGHDTIINKADLATVTGLNAQTNVDSTTANTIYLNHLAGSGSTPTVTLGTGAGTGPGAVSVTGDDIGGVIQFQAGTSPATSFANVFRVTFAKAYAHTPKLVMVTPGNSGACQLYPNNMPIVNVSTISPLYFEFTTTSAGVLTAGIVYQFYYFVKQ